MPLARLAGRLVFSAALLAAATGCVTDSGEPRPGASRRAFKDFTYADSALGYRLAVPSDWHGHVYSDSDYLDFLGYKKFAKFMHPRLDVVSDTLLDSTLRAQVEYWNRLSFRDSTVVGASQVRTGVEVIPVDRWYYGEYGTERSLRLYFLRRGQVVRLDLTHTAAAYDTSSEIRFIDSSLTFF